MEDQYTAEQLEKAMVLMKARGKNSYECESNIYDMELSLICDQRYGTEDMERMMSLRRIESFLRMI